MKIKRFNESIKERFLLPEEIEDYFLEVKDVLSISFNTKPKYFGHIETCGVPFSIKYKDFWNQHVGSTEDLEVYIKSLESIKNVCKRFNLHLNLESTVQFEIMQNIPDCILKNLRYFRLYYEDGYFLLHMNELFEEGLGEALDQMEIVSDELSIGFEYIGNDNYKMVCKT